jgi:hypothetical protein
VDHLFSQGTVMLGHGFPVFEVWKALSHGNKQFVGIWVRHGAVGS